MDVQWMYKLNPGQPLFKQPWPKGMIHAILLGRPRALLDSVVILSYLHVHRRLSGITWTLALTTSIGFVNTAADNPAAGAEQVWTMSAGTELGRILDRASMRKTEKIDYLVHTVYWKRKKTNYLSANQTPTPRKCKRLQLRAKLLFIHSPMYQW